MAYPAVHLLVAARAARGIPALDMCPAYLLGAIAPDAVHVRPGVVTKSPDKRASHLHISGTDGRDAVRTYWAEMGTDPYHLGYGVHVLTDRLWVAFYPDAFPALMRDGHTVPEVYMPDAAWMERALHWRVLRHTGIVDALVTAEEARANAYVAAREALAWRDRVLAQMAGYEGDAQGQPAAMDYGAVVAFIEEAGGDLHAILAEGTHFD